VPVRYVVQTVQRWNSDFTLTTNTVPHLLYCAGKICGADGTVT
jgi:hypothetical protein